MLPPAQPPPPPPSELSRLFLLIIITSTSPGTTFYDRFSVLAAFGRMDSSEARRLVLCCAPSFHAAALPPLAPDDIADVTCEVAASLWAGMGAVFEISVTHKSEKPPLRFMAKRVQLPAKCCSAGDQRKKDSYAVEAAFYSQGHAHRLIAAGACVPHPLHIDTSRSSGVTIYA